MHAHNVPLMNKLIRQQFLDMYKQPILERFIDEQIDRTGLDLHAFEEYGEHDIESWIPSISSHSAAPSVQTINYCCMPSRIWMMSTGWNQVQAAFDL